MFGVTVTRVPGIPNRVITIYSSYCQCKNCGIVKRLKQFESMRSFRKYCATCRQCRNKRTEAREHCLHGLLQHCKHCNPLGHLDSNVRARAAVAMKRIGRKISLTKDFFNKVLGLSMVRYKHWLEERFEPWMNWSNHGEWEIDHIKPLGAKGITYEEILKRLHYKNTQILTSLQNRKKFTR